MVEETLATGRRKTAVASSKDLGSGNGEDRYQRTNQ